MLTTQQKFSGILTEVIRIAKDSSIDSTPAEHLQAAVEQMTLPIPVVGEFSAGKSTLLNKFIGKNVLKVNIQPETAVASELYYSVTEYAEGVNRDGSTVRLGRVDEANQSLANFMCVRRYINSENLQRLQPLVLVDMPGFASPLDHHNKAIINYLEKGVHYIVLTPVDSGTITASMGRELQNIQSFNKDFTCFVTKTDLRSNEETDAVVQQLESGIFSCTGMQKNVSRLNHNDTACFSTMITALNPDELFSNVFIESVKNLLYEIKCSINVRLAALQKDAQQNAQAIEKLKEALRKIERRRDALIAEKQSANYREEADRIANAVGNELHRNMEALVEIGATGGSAALNDEINSIVQNIVITQINEIIGKINSDFSATLSKELQAFDKLFAGLNAAGIIERLQENAGNWYDSKRTCINAYIQERKSNAAGNLVYKGITGALALTTSIIAPVVELIIMTLPEIIGFITDLIRKKKVREDIRSLLTEKVPEIKRSIRTKVMASLTEQTQTLVQTVSAHFEEMLKEKTAEIEKAQEDLARTNNVSVEIEKLTHNLARLEALEGQI